MREGGSESLAVRPPPPTPHLATKKSGLPNLSPQQKKQEAEKMASAKTSARPAKAKPKAAPKERLSIAELAPRVVSLLPGKQAEIARALGRKPSDGAVRRALRNLEQSGAAQRIDGIWQRREGLPMLAIPADFDKQSAALHDRTLKALQEQGTWRDHDAELLERYVRRSQDVRAFRDAVREQGRFQTSDKGGRVYAHPGIDKERDALRDVQALADALVLTPDARKRHGRDGGDDDPADGFDF